MRESGRIERATPRSVAPARDANPNLAHLAGIGALHIPHGINVAPENPHGTPFAEMSYRRTCHETEALYSSDISGHGSHFVRPEAINRERAGSFHGNSTGSSQSFSSAIKLSGDHGSTPAGSKRKQFASGFYALYLSGYGRQNRSGLFFRLVYRRADSRRVDWIFSRQPK